MRVHYNSWHNTNEGVSIEMVMEHLAANGKAGKRAAGVVSEIWARMMSEGNCWSWRT